ncbi:MAG: peptide-methionine (R)-S-oxide reductase MsrB [Cyanophyceae cyanobacterium]
MNKRHFILSGAAALGSVWLSSNLPGAKAIASPTKTFEVTKTEAEWRRILTPAQFAVLRRDQTEPPYSSSLNEEDSEGIYSCAGCDQALFSSATKFESGTGWPSFYAPLDNAIGTSEDRTLFMVRTEVHCRRCGGHLGHVFDDGPAPTGKRYCMNGVALKFTAQAV